MMRRSAGDRRLKPRFDIVGELMGTLDASVLTSVRNIGRGGAQVESTVHLPAGSVHRAMFSGGGVDTSAQICVRHVKSVAARDGQERYLLGIEFLSPSPLLLDLVDRWLAAYGDEGSLAGGGR